VRQRYVFYDNIEVNVRERVCKVWTSSDSGKGPVADSGEKGDEPPGSTKNFNILSF
jgi:hypothetical protein